MFGNNYLLWFLPFGNPPIDGITWNKNHIMSKIIFFKIIFFFIKKIDFNKLLQYFERKNNSLLNKKNENINNMDKK